MKAETRINPTPGTLDEPNRLKGYAAKFDEPSQILYDEEVCKGPFVEVIAPGAFAASLKSNPDVRALYNHRAGDILGRGKNGTLKLWEDERGLAFDLALPDTSIGRDCRELVRRGDVDGCSFGFYVVRDNVEARAGEPSLRTLLEVDLYEITPATTFPAYRATEVYLRSLRADAGHAPAAAPAPPGRPALGLAAARLRLGRSGD